MAKFAHYYLEYLNDNMFANTDWSDRQKHFGNYFATDRSIEFTLDKGDGRMVYKHNVYHLSINKNIIVMRIANQKSKEVIQDFKPKSVKHEPHSYVIIDNRDRCRRIAIQKNKDAFNNTDSLKKILQEVLHTRMLTDHFIGLALHPQFYPRDFYEAWELHRQSTQRIRFNLSEGSLPNNFKTEELGDHDIWDLINKLNEEEHRKRYRTVLELNPPEDKAYLEVDKSSAFIRNLVNFHAATGASIELITDDGAHFTCFVENEEESDHIVTSEIDSRCLKTFFPDAAIDEEDEEARKALNKAEKELLECLNAMKIETNEEKGKEDIA